MTGYLEWAIEEISEADPLWSYGLVLVSAFLENVVPPVPGDTVVVFSAYLVGRGLLSWLPVYVATCTGGTVGFLAMYYLGYRGGRAFLSRQLGRFYSAESLESVEVWLSRYGIWIVLGNRFLSGIRSIIALGAGIGRMDWKLVAVGGFISMAIWNALLLYAGVVLGENWGRVVDFLEQYNQLWLVLIALVAIYAILRRRWRTASRNGGP